MHAEGDELVSRGATTEGARSPFGHKNTRFSGFLPLNYVLCIFATCVLKLETRGEWSLETVFSGASELSGTAGSGRERGLQRAGGSGAGAKGAGGWRQRGKGRGRGEGAGGWRQQGRGSGGRQMAAAGQGQRGRGRRMAAVGQGQRGRGRGEGQADGGSGAAVVRG